MRRSPFPAETTPMSLTVLDSDGQKSGTSLPVSSPGSKAKGFSLEERSSNMT